MIKKIIAILITTFTLIVNVHAGSDGDLVLKKNEPSEIKDCSETFNKASFALNQGLDKVIFKPVSSVYRVLPAPIKTGVSNSLNNLSNVVTIPNNVLQGQFKYAGVNSARLLINSTLGIGGIFDVASYYGLKKLDKDLHKQIMADLGKQNAKLVAAIKDANAQGAALSKMIFKAAGTLEKVQAKQRSVMASFEKKLEMIA